MFRTVAIVGATGAVGREFLRVMQTHRLAGDVRLLASARSAGSVIEHEGASLRVAELTPESFTGVDLALFSAGAGVSREFAPIAVQAGAVVIDNSSAFRMRPDVPLVVPEINPHDARSHRGIIANPNCSAIVMAMAVWPLHRVNPVHRILVSTYQAISGAGLRAMHELEEQTAAVLRGEPARPRVLPHACAFNVFSHNTPIGADGYNVEEQKIAEETRKIFHAPGLAVAATCIRVPVLRAHSEAIYLEFERPMPPEQAREILTAAPGVRVVDDRAANRFPMPLDAAGGDDVLVGRIRADASLDDGRGLALFVSGDQLRKGAALNAVQIAELLGGS